MFFDASALFVIRALITDLATTAGASLPADRRAEVVGILTSALIGPVACDEYCSALEGELAHRGVVGPADVSLGEFPVEALLRDGLPILSDDQLFRLGLSPSTVRSLNQRVWWGIADGSAGETWLEAADSIPEGIPPSYLGQDSDLRIVNFILELERDRTQESRPTVLSPFWSRSLPLHQVAYAISGTLAATLIIAAAVVWFGRQHVPVEAGTSDGRTVVRVDSPKMLGPREELIGKAHRVEVSIFPPRDGVAVVVKTSPAEWRVTDEVGTQRRDPPPENDPSRRGVDEDAIGVNLEAGRSVLIVIVADRVEGAPLHDTVRKLLPTPPNVSIIFEEWQQTLVASLKQAGHRWWSVTVILDPS